jgi:hypothetical protein
MLDVVPEYLEQVAVVAEMFLDLNTVTVEEVTGRIRAVEQRRRKKSTPTVDSQGRLLLTREEWMAKWKISGASGDKGSSSGAGGSGGGGGGNWRPGASRGRRHGNSGGARQAARPVDASGPAKKMDKCRYCGKKGHWAKECRSRLRDEAHLAQAEYDEEPMLNVATAEVNATSSFPTQISSASPAAPLSPIHLNDPKLFVQLGSRSEGEST